MWGQMLKAVFRGAFGTNAALETAEARKEAREAIGLMGTEADNLVVLIKEEGANGKPVLILTVDEALEAIATDLGKAEGND